MHRRQFLAAAAPAAALPLLVRDTSADPDAVRTVQPGQSIQAALDEEPGRVVLAPGVHVLSEPLRLGRRRWLDGHFGATTLRAEADMTALVEVGGGGPVDRWRISNLVLDARGLATTGIDVHVSGTAGNDHGEPDSQGRLDDLVVMDAGEQGVWYRGTDAQAVVTTSVRVRRAGTYGFRIENADSWWRSCEATTRASTGAGFFVNGTGGGGSNLHFDHCKAWYCRGYGWHVRGSRNTFTGCEAQDTRDHGFFVQWDGNCFTGCVADTAAMWDVGGEAGAADGFYVSNRAVNVVLAGCLAFDRRPRGRAAQQRYGFNVPEQLVDEGRLSATAGWDNVGGLVHQRG